MRSPSTRLPSPQGPATDHRVAGQAAEEMLAALTAFLAPYREGGGGLR